MAIGEARAMALATQLTMPLAGSCLNPGDVHPHVGDDTARNHYGLLWCLAMMIRIPMHYYYHGNMNGAAVACSLHKLLLDEEEARLGH
jgi:hypothetical protein